MAGDSGENKHTAWTSPELCPERDPCIFVPESPSSQWLPFLGDVRRIPLYEISSSLNPARVREFNIPFGQIGFGWGEVKESRSRKVN